MPYSFLVIRINIKWVHEGWFLKRTLITCFQIIQWTTHQLSFDDRSTCRFHIKREVYEDIKE